MEATLQARIQVQAEIAAVSHLDGIATIQAESDRRHKVALEELHVGYQEEMAQLAGSHAAALAAHAETEAKLKEALSKGEEDNAGLAMTVVDTEDQLAMAYSELERQGEADETARRGLQSQVTALREALVSASKRAQDQLQEETARVENETREMTQAMMGRAHAMDLEDLRARHLRDVERLVAEHEERLEKEKTLVEFSSRVAEESER